MIDFASARISVSSATGISFLRSAANDFSFAPARSPRRIMSNESFDILTL